MALPGVKVGPLDPEATRDFGQVSGAMSARTLIRLHRQMYPPQLLRQLVRPEDVPRSHGLDLDEVREYVGGLEHPNGDPLVPEGARIVGAAVRGDESTGRVLTFQYQLPSGRVGKWHAPYDEDVLPQSFSQGAERARVKEMRDRGLVSLDEGATDAEILRRQLHNSRQENERLRRQLETGSDPGAGGTGEEELTGAAGRTIVAGENVQAELEQFRRANQELSQRNAQLEQVAATVTGSGGGAVPTGGLEGDIENRAAQQTPADGSGEPAESAPAGSETVAAQEPPVDGYDELKADDVVARIKSEETSQEDVTRILEYERTHANRRTVTGAAEQRLDRASG